MKARILIVVLVLALPLVVSQAQSDGQEYIVQVHRGESIDKINNNNGTRTLRQIPGTSWYLVKSNGQLTQDAERRLKTDAAADLVERNARLNLIPAQKPTFDLASISQAATSIDGTTLTTFYGMPVLKAYVEQPAVSVTRVKDVRHVSTGAATKVAYIDTGVDFYHIALMPWLDPGVDLVNSQSASEFDGLDQQMTSLLDQQMTSLLDHRMSSILNQAMASLLDGGTGARTSLPSAFGHGTLVAGVIHLVAPMARIIPIKAFDAYGNTTLYSIIEGLYRARDLGADVINMSFSLNANYDTLKRAVQDVYSSGISLVASAGNDGVEASDYFPAAYTQVVGVGATDFDDRRASFSNYGKAITVDAPGAYLISTVPGGKYAAAWGTSFSAPMVAGAIALVKSLGTQGLSATTQSVNTADSIDAVNPNFRFKLGKGRINVAKALNVQK